METAVLVGLAIVVALVAVDAIARSGSAGPRSNAKRCGASIVRLHERRTKLQRSRPDDAGSSPTKIVVDLTKRE